jgi:hypothetical protein
MTIPYNAEKFSCFVKFIEKLEDDGIFYRKMNDDEKFYIRNMHERYY